MWLTDAISKKSWVRGGLLPAQSREPAGARSVVGERLATPLRLGSGAKPTVNRVRRADLVIAVAVSLMKRAGAGGRGQEGWGKLGEGEKVFIFI